jgi:hypothetical protein
LLENARAFAVLAKMPLAFRGLPGLHRPITRLHTAGLERSRASGG